MPTWTLPCINGIVRSAGKSIIRRDVEMEACPLKKRDINSLDFVVNRLFMKLLKTSDINTVRTCQHMFGFELPSVLLDRRTRKFLEKMKNL